MTNLMFSCDVPPHDEENCSTNEAELNGAGEKERRTVLNELGKMMGSEKSATQFSAILWRIKFKDL